MEAAKNKIYRGFWHREMMSIKVKNFVLFFKKLSGKTCVCPEAATGGVLKNFAKFTGKHLCQGLFFNKVAGLFYWNASKYHYLSNFIYFLFIGVESNIQNKKVQREKMQLFFLLNTQKKVTKH